MSERLKTQRNGNGTLTVAGDRTRKRPTGTRVLVMLDPKSSNKVEAQLAQLFAVVDAPSFLAREILLQGAQTAQALIKAKIDQLGGLEIELTLDSKSAVLTPQRTPIHSETGFTTNPSVAPVELTVPRAANRVVPPLNFGSMPKSASEP